MNNLLKNFFQKIKSNNFFPEFIFDTNYEKIILKKKNFFSIKNSLSNNHEELIKNFDENNYFEGFEKLCRDSFLILLSRIKSQKGLNIKAKYLFVDFETGNLIKKLISWLELKENEVSCIYILDEDQLNNCLTEQATMFYIISYNYFKNSKQSFFNEIKNRKSLKINIFFREQKNFFDENDIKLLKQISEITKNEIRFLNLFLPLNDKVVLLDNSIDNLRLIKDLINLKEKNCLEIKKISNRLAYLLFKLKLSPTFKYFNNLNNIKIALETSDLLDKIYKENRTDSINYNCTILIIDRSLDLITPLLHTNNYYEFLNEEYEINYDLDFKFFEQNLELVSLNEIAEKLINISKDLTNSHIELNKNQIKSFNEIILFENKATTLHEHIEFLNKIRIKIINGYQHLVNCEQNLIENINDLDEKNFFINLKKIFGKKISSLDWKRLLCIYFIMRKPTKTKTIRQLNKKKLILTKQDLKEIKEFELINQKLNKKNNLKKKFLNLKTIIQQFELNELDQSKFIKLNKKENKSNYQITSNNQNTLNNQTVSNVQHNSNNQKSLNGEDNLDVQNKSKNQTELNNKMKLNSQNELNGQKSSKELKNLSELNQIKSFNQLNHQIKFNNKSNNNSSLNKSKSLFNEKTESEKLIVFMLGGISFKEINLVKNNENLILISDSIVYPKNFIKNLTH